MLVTLPYGQRFGVLERSSNPAVEPLTLSEAKLYLRVDGTAEDTLITELIVAAREAAEQFMRRSLITQGWTLWFDDYATSVVRLPMGPIQSITHVKTYDRDGNATTLNAEGYYLNAGRERIIFDVAPLGEKVEIVYVTGYGDDASDVPRILKQGMLQHLTAMYDERGGLAAIPPAVHEVYGPFRWEAL